MNTKQVRRFKMRYYSRLKKYKASNVEFDCETQTAWSYGWWNFYRDGVFNNTNYSPTTIKHQSKMHDVLRQEGLGITLMLNRTRLSLDNLQAAIRDELYLMNEEIRQVQIKLDGLKNKTGKRGQSYTKQIENMSKTKGFFEEDSRRYLREGY